MHLSKCTIHLSEIYKPNATYVKIRNMQSSFGQVLQVFHMSDCHFYSSQLDDQTSEISNPEVIPASISWVQPPVLIILLNLVIIARARFRFTNWIGIDNQFISIQLELNWNWIERFGIGIELELKAWTEWNWWIQSIHFQFNSSFYKVKPFLYDILWKLQCDKQSHIATKTRWPPFSQAILFSSAL